jgi:hypothetical protein
VKKKRAYVPQAYMPNAVAILKPSLRFKKR